MREKEHSEQLTREARGVASEGRRESVERKCAVIEQKCLSIGRQCEEEWQKCENLSRQCTDNTGTQYARFERHSYESVLNAIHVHLAQSKVKDEIA